MLSKNYWPNSAQYAKIRSPVNRCWPYKQFLARKHLDTERTVQSQGTKVKAETLISYSCTAMCWLSAPGVFNNWVPLDT